MLADRKREGGAFELARAERLWWQQYVPLPHVVCVDGLPMTAAADQLAHESTTTPDPGRASESGMSLVLQDYVVKQALSDKC